MRLPKKYYTSPADGPLCQECITFLSCNEKPPKKRITRRKAVKNSILHYELMLKDEDSSTYDGSEDGEYVPPKRKTRSIQKSARKPLKLKLSKLTEKISSERPRKKRMKFIPGVKQWQCKKCPEMFETFRDLKLHRKVHKPKDVSETHTYKLDIVQDLYVCNTCDAEFQEEEEAKKHCNAHDEQFKCRECSAKFKTAYHLGCHSSEHNDMGLLNCPLCTYQVGKRNGLLMHINYVHLKKFLYVCETCGKGFNDAVLFKEHDNEHLGLRPFACIVCQKSFPYSRYLYTHQVRSHRVGIDGQLLPNQCPYCNKCFSKKPTLEKHMQNTHMTDPVKRERKHLCDTCGKGFRQKNKLVIHERVHTGVKPYTCKYCDKGFTKKDYLIMHERVHSGEKPYSCEYCGKCFSQGAPLRIHLRTHTGERPYVCQFCSAGFTSRGGLNVHCKNCTGQIINLKDEDEYTR